MTRIATRIAELQAGFETTGARRVETAVLQPAATLLDLYGEDIRARAYVTSDALRGEQMLRPDFTVPVVQQHMTDGAEPARYTYAGTVFRRQETDETRPNEYPQVGYEVFDRTAPMDADAEVFALIQQTLGSAPVRASMGDLALLMSAVDGLETSDARKAALRRHVWRPQRFRALLDRFSKTPAWHADRLAAWAAQDPFAQAGPEIGLRGRGEVEARMDALRDDATTAPLHADQMAGLDRLLNVRGPLPEAIQTLDNIAQSMPSIAAAVANLTDRLAALRARDFNAGELQFEASYGRTQMEYYDGFVFGIYATAHESWPPIATGGRYDALTRHLGGGAEIPAVGGVVRPDLLAQLEDAQ